uniref:Heavy metal-associated isoprenylated plant protein 26-like n=1 Tax=Rhizophora mucronata TaxID=61149 RepID=A0A2P2J9G8_RHIMU
MGALDHFSDLFDCSSGSSKLKKRKQLQVPHVPSYYSLYKCIYFLFGVY